LICVPKLEPTAATATVASEAVMPEMVELMAALVVAAVVAVPEEMRAR
jgi:hypothetical protein